MADPENTIAFIGLGVMGYPMAVNLRSKIGKDKTFVVCDISTAACEKFRLEESIHGPIEIVENGFEAIAAANTLLTVLPSSEAMKTVYLDPTTGILAGALENADQRKLTIECGTIAQSMISEVAEALSRLDNVDFVDAPISGGPIGSKEGTLAFMVGCSKAMFLTLKPLLEHMGKPESIFHCGDVGAGTAFKIINNYISLISVLSVSEAYGIASKMKLDLNVLTDLFNSGSAQCWVTSKNNPVPGIHPNAAASHGYEGGFRIELAHKVLSLGKELAEMVGAKTTLDKAALEVYGEVAADPRYAGKDARVVYKYLTENPSCKTVADE